MTETGAAQYLVCRVGCWYCAVPLHIVVETMRPLPLSPLSGEAKSLCGMTIYRGNPVPVVHTAALLGLGDSAETQRFVAVAYHGRHAALAVDAVIGVRTLRQSDLSSVASFLEVASRGSLEYTSVLGGSLLAVLDAAKVLPSEIWENLTEQLREAS